MYNSGVTQSVDIKQELLRRLNEAEKKAGQSYLTVLGPGDTITYRINPELEENPYGIQESNRS